MTSDHWRKVDSLVFEALSRPARQRDAFVEAACAGDVLLRQEVASLLGRASAASGFLEVPVAPRRLGDYELLSLVGAGGMGEVYRARDVRLERDVAVKILPTSFAADPERLARFEREARVLAALNHPNIVTIYGLAEADGLFGLVLELVQGETLADRLARGPLTWPEAKPIARQILLALEAAHAQNIIHRDLKPANISLTPGGLVKVLDFGLAKTIEGRAADSAAGPPTASAAMAATVPGLILGTAAYMSPEQARGQPVDKRSDVWAFGCVLYELATGHVAFPGATAAETMAQVLERDPDWTRLPPGLPNSIHRLLRRCLQRDPDRRLRDVGDARLELESDAEDGGGAHTVVVASPTRLKRTIWVGAALVLAGALTAVATWFLKPPSPEKAGATTRFEVVTPATSEAFSFALSPDGRQLAFVAAVEGVSRLWIRPLDSTSAQPLPGTEGASNPFWSPDARAVGFFANGKLKRVDVAGGVPLVLADVSVSRGGTWSPGGVIVFGPGKGLKQVAATGGVATPVTTLAAGQGSHRWPQFLPDGRRFLFFSGLGPATHGVYLGSLDGGEPKFVFPSETAGFYAPPGYLLLVDAHGALVARRLDAARGRVEDTPVTVAQSIGADDGLLHSSFAVSAAGVLAYRAGGPNRHQLVWANRSGTPLGVLGPPDDTWLSNPALAPDGRTVAVNRSLPDGIDVWLIDVARASVTRLTLGLINARPVWSPDSSRVVFTSQRNGHAELFEKPASRARVEQPLAGIPQHDVAPLDWSSDGRFLLYAARDENASSDLWALPMTGDRTPVPIATSRFDETQGQFSPDGHWVAYVSDETGRTEVYLRRFPEDNGRSQVSIDGGRFPRWRRDGRELFFVAPDQRLMAAPLQVSADARTATPGVPVALFSTRLASNSAFTGYLSRAQYDVAPDGRFLMNVGLEDVAPPPITIVLNWVAALGRR